MNKIKSIIKECKKSISADSLKQLQELEQEDFSKFWAEASKYLNWKSDWKSVQSHDKGRMRWFEEGEISYFEQIFNGKRSEEKAFVSYDVSGQRQELSFDQLEKKSTNMHLCCNPKES